MAEFELNGVFSICPSFGLYHSVYEDKFNASLFFILQFEIGEMMIYNFCSEIPRCSQIGGFLQSMFLSSNPLRYHTSVALESWNCVALEIEYEASLFTVH